MQQSRRKILKTASDLFSEFGFLGVSMDTIAKKLNITKAALYYHFKSKKELYFEVLEKSFQNLIESIEEEISKADSPEETII
ncbi:TetR/AcrR family transcriptional regulator, partial [bacterium]|nr:TetR/AcrR family transcriptional regulator [bacterium]